MRFLFAFVAGNGHFAPLVPIAQSTIDAGHDVLFAAQPKMVPIVEAAGFEIMPTSRTSRFVTDDNPRKPLLPPSAEREDDTLRTRFAGTYAASRAADIIAISANWNPDLIVCDELDFGAMLAAEHLNIPHVTVLVIASGSMIRVSVISEPLNERRAEIGLSPDPDLAMLYGSLTISPFPPSYRDPAHPLPPNTHSIRPSVIDANDDIVPAWIADLEDRPTIYFTLGTIFNLESGDLFNRVLSGLRDLDANIVMTVGRDIDPAEFGPQPSNIHIERYTPQSILMPYVDLVISHGGSGTVMGALAYGLPQIVIPLAADQLMNAARVVNLGLGRSLDPITLSSQQIRDTTTSLLTDQPTHTAAQRIRDEIANLPPATSAIPRIESLVLSVHS